nr:nuclease Le3=5'-nucleotide-forming nuclease {N-terminal} [Lentinula edodes, shiitake mushroom, Peptide Partial, 23 aa] [Lentinula edodes]
WGMLGHELVGFTASNALDPSFVW